MKAIKTLVASVALAMPMLASATAEPLFFPGFQQLSDNNAEYLINADGTRASVDDSTLDEGDRLRGIFTIETIESLTGLGQNNLSASGVELTGLFDIRVISKVANGAGGWDFAFAATGNLGSSGGQDIVAQLYDSSTLNFSRLEATVAASEGTVTDGNPFLNLGILNYWIASAVTDDINLVGSIPAPQTGGSFNASLSILDNFSGLTFNTVTCGFVTGQGPLALHQADVCGSGSLLGTGGISTPFDSFSNVDFTVNVVPEPGSLALLGLGLTGLAAARRRRKA